MIFVSSNAVRRPVARRPDPARRSPSASPSGPASSPCSSAASRSPSRRSWVAPARRASPASSWSSCGSPTAWTSAVRSSLLSPFHWTVNHIPLVGFYDWTGARRGGGRRGHLPRHRRRAVQAPRPRGDGRPLAPRPAEGRPRRPRPDQPGLRRPAAAGARVGDRAWASWARSSRRSSARSPTRSGSTPSLVKTFATIFPGFDFATAGGWLQLYVELFYIAAGFAAATFVSKWASDETDGRLERRSSRRRWRAPAG